jgi:hypothetical protein
VLDDMDLAILTFLQRQHVAAGVDAIARGLDRRPQAISQRLTGLLRAGLIEERPGGRDAEYAATRRWAEPTPAPAVIVPEPASIWDEVWDTTEEQGTEELPVPPHLEDLTETLC